MIQLIQGMPVILYDREQTGVNAFGEPVYTESPVTVEDVLVSPSANEDIVNDIQLYGKKAEYRLAIPKGDTHEWEDRTVEFFGRKWRTFGIVEQGIEANVPTRWHKKIRVERYE